MEGGTRRFIYGVLEDGSLLPPTVNLAPKSWPPSDDSMENLSQEASLNNQPLASSNILDLLEYLPTRALYCSDDRAENEVPTLVVINPCQVGLNSDVSLGRHTTNIPSFVEMVSPCSRQKGKVCGMVQSTYLHLSSFTLLEYSNTTLFQTARVGREGVRRRQSESRELAFFWIVDVRIRVSSHVGKATLFHFVHLTHS